MIPFKGKYPLQIRSTDIMPFQLGFLDLLGPVRLYQKIIDCLQVTTNIIDLQNYTQISRINHKIWDKPPIFYTLAQHMQCPMPSLHNTSQSASMVQVKYQGTNISSWTQTEHTKKNSVILCVCSSFQHICLSGNCSLKFNKQ